MAAVTSMCLPLLAYAAADETTSKAIGFLNDLQLTLHSLLYPVLLLCGGLMDNSLLFDFGMEQTILSIWVPIRNITNIFFVLILVGLALYNVIGIGGKEGKFSLKAVLPQLIIGIITVNFSFIAIKVLISIFGVLTTSIFALPMDLGMGNLEMTSNTTLMGKFCLLSTGISPSQLGNYKNDPTKITNRLDIMEYLNIISQPGFLDKDKVKWDGFEGIKTAEAADDLAGLKTAIGPELQDPHKMEEVDKIFEERKKNRICAAEGTTFVLSDYGKKFLTKYDSNNAALAMAVDMGGILNFKDLTGADKNVESLTIDILFQLMMYLIYAASFIALGIVLLVRLVVIWITIVISPILLLARSIPAMKESMGEIGEMWKKFIANAMAPLIMAIFMTVGWIMMNGVKSISGSQTLADIGSNGIPVAGLNTLQELIVSIGTVAVVWMGVFTAAGQTAAAGITNVLKGALESAGTWVGLLPLKYMPLYANKGKVNYKQDENFNPSMFTAGMGLKRALKSIASDQEETKEQGDFARYITGDTNWSYDELATRTEDEWKNILSSSKRNVELASGNEQLHAAMKTGFENRNSGLFKLASKDQAVMQALKSYANAEKENYGATGTVLANLLKQPAHKSSLGLSEKPQSSDGAGVTPDGSDASAKSKPGTAKKETTTTTTTLDGDISSKMIGQMGAPATPAGTIETAVKNIKPENRAGLQDFIKTNNIDLGSMDMKDKTTIESLAKIYDKFIGKIKGETKDDKENKAKEAIEFLKQVK